MSETSPFMKIVLAVGGLLALAVPVFGVGQYVSDLRHEIDESKSEVSQLRGQVVQLQDILQKSQASINPGARGPKGDKGDQGDPGPQGERGPAGPIGPAGQSSGATSTADIQKLVDAAVAAKISVMPVTSSAIVDVSGSVDLSQCVPTDEVKKMKVLSIKVGTELCDRDGLIIQSVKQFNDRNDVRFFATDGGYWWCNVGSRCGFRFDNDRYFTINRSFEKDGARYVTLAFTEKN